MHATSPVAALTALRLLATLAAVYVISQFFRASQAVIAPELADGLGLTGADLGLLAGVFFVVFALAQLVNGPLFDRFGPRRTMPALLVFAAIGSLVFASADGLWGLLIGRALMGLGCSGILVGALLVCARWFPRDRYAGLASILVASGESGNLLATSPFAALVEAIGWRGAFVLMAAATAVLCVLAYVGVRDAPPGHAFHTRRPESPREAWRGTIEAFRQPGLARVIAAALVVYGAAMAIFGLWGGPYFNDVHDLDAVARGNAMLAMAVAMLCGTLLSGPLDRKFDTRKGVVQAGLAGLAAVLSALALLTAPPLWTSIVLFASLGAFAGVRVVVMAHGRALFPERLMGRGVSLINMGIMGGVALLQIATGGVMGALAQAGASKATAYRIVFAVLALIVSAGWLAYRGSTDRRPSDERMP